MIICNNNNNANDNDNDNNWGDGGVTSGDRTEGGEEGKVEGEEGKLSRMGRDGIEGSVRGPKKTVICYDKSKARQRGRSNNCTSIAKKMKRRPVVGYKYLHIKKAKMTAHW